MKPTIEIMVTHDANWITFKKGQMTGVEHDGAGFTIRVKESTLDAIVRGDTLLLLLLPGGAECRPKCKPDRVEISDERDETEWVDIRVYYFLGKLAGKKAKSFIDWIYANS